MTLRDSLDGVAGLPLEPPREMPERPTSRPCPAKGCDDGVIYAGRASFDTGDATLTGSEEFETCGMCGGLGECPA